MSEYTRNGKVVSGFLTVDNKQIFCSKDCYVHIPVRFIDRDIASIGSDNNSFGIFPIIIKDTKEYGVLCVNAIVQLNPFTVEQISVNGDDYYQLFFEANTAIITNTSVVRKDTIIYNILDEFIIKGKVPWYMGYEDLAKFLDTADSHAGSKVANNYELIEILASIISRDTNNRKVYMRVAATDKNYVKKNIEYVPLASVMYSVKGTVNKLIGAYMDEGLTSALVSESNETSHVETLLRS